MSKARYTKNGFLIPNDWLKGWDDDVRVQRGKGVLIIESKKHASARRKLAKMIKELRATSKKLAPLTENDINEIVNEVRQARAGYR